MKPSAYPLQAALEQREAARKDARRRLAESLRELERQVRRLEEREEERAALIEDAGERRARLYDPGPSGLLEMLLVTRRTEELRYVEGRIAEADRAIDEQRRAVVRAEGAVEDCRASLMDADRELKAVEKHRQGWREERRRAAARKEQRQSEEVVTARFATERAGGDEGEGA